MFVCTITSSIGYNQLLPIIIFTTVHFFLELCSSCFLLQNHTIESKELCCIFIPPKSLTKFANLAFDLIQNFIEQNEELVG